MQITAFDTRLARVLLDEIALRAGADVVARVAEAPADGGRGLLSLAGALLAAELPPGLVAGQRLPLRVLGATESGVLLQVRDTGNDRASAGGGATARSAGALAVRGDGQLLQAASVLQQPGLALPLPNGDAVTLRVPDDHGCEDGGDGSPGRGRDERAAGFVLHSALFGPVEVRVRSTGATVGVDVTVAPELGPAAEASAPALARAIERSTGAPATVGVTRRRANAPSPRPPRVEGGLDRYA